MKRKYDIDYSLIPEHMRRGVEDYVENGLKPGDFLVSVLENNFVDSIARADSINKYRLYDWAKFLYEEMPIGSWGSKEKVEAWMKKKREEAR